MTENLYNIYKELSSEISFNFEEHEEFKLPNDKMMPVLLIKLQEVNSIHTSKKMEISVNVSLKMMGQVILKDLIHIKQQD